MHAAASRAELREGNDLIGLRLYYHALQFGYYRLNSLCLPACYAMLCSQYTENSTPWYLVTCSKRMSEKTPACLCDAVMMMDDYVLSCFLSTFIFARSHVSSFLPTTYAYDVVPFSPTPADSSRTNSLFNPPSSSPQSPSPAYYTPSYSPYTNSTPPHSPDSTYSDR